MSLLPASTAAAIAAVAAGSSAPGSFHWQTLLTFVGGAVLLAFFSSLGILARIRERRIEQRRAAQTRPQPPAEPGPPGSGAP